MREGDKERQVSFPLPFFVILAAEREIIPTVITRRRHLRGYQKRWIATPLKGARDDEKEERDRDDERRLDPRMREGDKKKEGEGDRKSEVSFPRRRESRAS
jgi:hypothetical protein